MEQGDLQYVVPVGLKREAFSLGNWLNGRGMFSMWGIVGTG